MRWNASSMRTSPALAVARRALRFSADDGIPILLYHKIGTPQRASRIKRQYVSPGLFRLHMQCLVRAGYQAVSLGQVLRCVEGGAAPSRKPIAITFDDGYAGLYHHALPVLRELGLTATVFLVADYLGRPAEWERLAGDVAEPLLTVEQIREMTAAGIAFGSHTRSHPRLTSLAPRRAADEIGTSKAILERRLETPIEFLAYPYGAFDRAALDLARRAGYLGACSTRRGVNRPGEDPFALRRVNIRRYNVAPRFLWKLRRAYRTR